MPVLGAFMVPHPPMIIPAVGRGSEREIEKTTEAYEEAARRIAALSPETIVITSPHTVMYSDYFHISPGKRASGSMAQFRAPEVRFTEEYDTELVRAISEAAEREGFPAGTEGERDASLDHATMVPLYFIRKYEQNSKIVRIGLSGLSLADHYRLGQMIRKEADRLNRKVVFVASGDLSHKLQSYGPYGFAPEGPQYDRRIMEDAGCADFGAMLRYDETFCEKAAECGHRSFVIMAGFLDRTAVKAEVLSHEDVTGVGYGICCFTPEGPDESRNFLDQYLEEEKAAAEERCAREDPYVRLARESLTSWIRDGKRLSVPADIPEEMRKMRAGAFVSLHENGRLRGCIGTIRPTTPSVAEEIIQNAVSASTQDPRFDPVRKSELAYLEISVDVLGEPEKISSPAELDVKRYGVIVTSGYKRGLLLPDLDGVDTVEQQISIAMQKGGIRRGEHYSLERFEVVRHH